MSQLHQRITSKRTLFRGIRLTRHSEMQMLINDILFDIVIIITNTVVGCMHVKYNVKLTSYQNASVYRVHSYALI